jgi:hypothetical protein
MRGALINDASAFQNDIRGIAGKKNSPDGFADAVII